jgi:hypothetical protein
MLGTRIIKATATGNKFSLQYSRNTNFNLVILPNTLENFILFNLVNASIKNGTIQVFGTKSNF